MYIVKIKVTQTSNDYENENYFKGVEYHLIDYEINASDEDTAVNEAVNSYYKEKWTNAEWRSSEFDSDMKKFKENLKKLSKDSFLRKLPFEDSIIKEYESELRKELGCSDKTYKEFVLLSIFNKIQYLEEIGCNLEYFAYPNKLSN